MNALLRTLTESAQAAGVALDDHPAWDPTVLASSSSTMTAPLTHPTIASMSETDGELTMEIHGCSMGVINSLRRAILADIPICCIRTETDDVNQCRVLVDQTRLHNEILKQRLSCIPIHTSDLTRLPGNYELVLDLTNDTEHVILVTSGHFRVRSKTAPETFLPDEEVRTLFPADPLSGDFIEFARLRPGHGRLPGERLHLVADFSVATAADNAMFNVTSKCTYSAAIDWPRARAELQRRQEGWRAEGVTSADVSLRSHNFLALDAQTFVLPDVVNFTVRSILPSALPNVALLRKAVEVLIDQLVRILNSAPWTDAEVHVNTATDGTAAGGATELRNVVLPQCTAIGSIHYAMRTLFPEHFCAIYSPHPHASTVVLRIPREVGHSHCVASIAGAMYVLRGLLP
jgi:hypothetical protein